MRISLSQLLLVILLSSLAYAKEGMAQEILKQPVTLHLEETELRVILNQLERSGGFHFVYSPNIVPATRRLSIHVKKQPLAEVLHELLTPLKIQYEPLGGEIVLKKIKDAAGGSTDTPTQAGIADRTITGKVVSAQGEPLIGVTVQVKGKSIGTSTNVDGTYTLTLDEMDEVLVFSYVGYLLQEVKVNGRSAVNITLLEDQKTLSEVVVVGYGTQKKVSVTGAISTVNAANILKAPVSNVANALAGRTTGITTTQRGGEPGRDVADIYIRGIGTFAGAESARPLVLVDGVERSLSGIDPYTIESLNILKDASATAVFGVRGANGVILITTKTGEAGKPQFTFSNNFAVQAPIRLPDMLDAVDYATLRNEAEANDTQNPNARKFSEYDIERYRRGDDPYFHPNIDWMDYMIKDYAPQQQYNLNVSGGTKDAKYFVSLGYFSQDGAYKLGDFFKEFSANPNYKRYNIRTNFDFNVTKKLTVSFKAGSDLSNANYAGSDTRDIFGTILSANPIMSPVLFEDKIVRNVKGLTGWQISNTPLYQMLTQGFNSNFTSNLNTNISARYNLDAITDGLLVRGQVAYDNYYLQTTRRSKQIPLWDLEYDPGAKNFNDSINPVPVVNSYEGPVSFVGESFSKNRKMYGEAALEYGRSFADHTVSALALGIAERYYNGNNELPFNLLSLVGRVTYDFKSKYFAEFNMGYNGSENFAVGKQFGFFPAGSVGYILTEEPFFPENNAFTYLKLRGSYGHVGNGKIGGSRFLFLPSSFQSGNTYYFGTAHTPRTGYTESSLGNPNVTWEVAKKMNLGTDFKFFNDRLTFSADYFTEKRDRILYNLNVPITFGPTNLIAPYNIGVAENRGYEFELGFRNDLTTRDFGYWVNANYSFARNKIVYQDETPQPFPGLAATGSRIGQPKGLLADGLYNTMEEILDPSRPKSEWEGAGLKPGDIRYIDVNGDGFINDNDRVNIGHPNVPEVMYGTSFGVHYKGLEVSVLFQGAANVSAYLVGEGVWPFIAGTKTAFANAWESWSQQRYENGDKISLPRLTASPEGNKHNYRTSSFWQQDASYLRVKNLEIAYTFRSTLVNRVGVKDFRVFANGQNLHTWTRMPYFDPEIANSNGAIYPMVQVFNIGSNLRF